MPTFLLQVVVIAKLLEARRSFGNLFGLRLSPSKTSLNQQQAASPRSSLGGGTPRRTSQVWDPQCDTVPEADQGEGGQEERRDLENRTGM